MIICKCNNNNLYTQKNGITVCMTCGKDDKNSNVTFASVSVNAHPIVELLIQNLHQDEGGLIAQCVIKNQEFKKIESSFFLTEEIAQEIIDSMQLFLNECNSQNAKKDKLIDSKGQVKFQSTNIGGYYYDYDNHPLKKYKITEMNNQSFFMVYLEGEKNPTFKHYTLTGAEDEAKRLSKAHGRKAFVLCSLKSFEVTDFTIKDCRPEIKDLPF